MDNAEIHSDFEPVHPRQADYSGRPAAFNCNRLEFCNSIGKMGARRMDAALIRLMRSEYGTSRSTNILVVALAPKNFRTDGLFRLSRKGCRFVPINRIP